MLKGEIQNFSAELHKGNRKGVAKMGLMRVGSKEGSGISEKEEKMWKRARRRGCKAERD